MTEILLRQSIDLAEIYRLSKSRGQYDARIQSFEKPDAENGGFQDCGTWFLDTWTFFFFLIDDIFS